MATEAHNPMAVGQGQPDTCGQPTTCPTQNDHASQGGADRS